MFRFSRLKLLALTVGFFALPAFAHEARLELGAFQTGNNRFNIPNPGGSRVHVENDSLKFYGRANGMIQVSDRGFIRVLVAPLNAEYGYVAQNAVAFNGVTIPAGSAVEVKYKFNSYRLGYAHRFPLSDNFYLQAGLIGKIRQARIAVSGGGQSAEYSNVGFVPLLNFGFGWIIDGPWELRFDLDGAAAKQGRAFDGALEAFYRISENGTGLSAGVRILEGGADNEKVNTFALIRYGFLAFTKGF